MNITLKEVPPALHERLKALAEQTGRSLNREIIHTLESVILPTPVDRTELIARIRERREQIGGNLRPGDLERAIREDRP